VSSKVEGGFPKPIECEELLDLLSARANRYCGCCFCRRASKIAATTAAAIAVATDLEIVWSVLVLGVPETATQ
jgi:hypothetical protein